MAGRSCRRNGGCNFKGCALPIAYEGVMEHAPSMRDELRKALHAQVEEQLNCANKQKSGTTASSSAIPPRRHLEDAAEIPTRRSHWPFNAIVADEKRRGEILRSLKEALEAYLGSCSR